MQCIAFDLGNVVFHINLAPIFDKMKSFGYDENTTQRLLIEYEKPSYLGIIDFKDFFTRELITIRRNEEFSDDNDASLIAGVLTTAWRSDCIYANQQMINFITNLKDEGIKTAALSNVGPIHGELLRENKQFNDLFDVIHFSCEVGAFKPQKLFFQSFLMQHDEFAGCLYLDDRLENVQAASEHKFDSVHFDLDKITSQPPSVLKKELLRIKERISRGY